MVRAWIKIKEDASFPAEGTSRVAVVGGSGKSQPCPTPAIKMSQSGIKRPGIEADHSHRSGIFTVAVRFKTGSEPLQTIARVLLRHSGRAFVP